MKPREIKGARARLGYTQQYVAEQLDISYPSYRVKESGKVRFSDEENGFAEIETKNTFNVANLI